MFFLFFLHMETRWFHILVCDVNHVKRAGKTGNKQVESRRSDTLSDDVKTFKMS